MIRKIFRYSHLYLAVSSSLFLLLASITGIILAFEPIQKQISYGHQLPLEEVYLSDILPKVKASYDEVLELRRSDDDLIIVSALSLEDDIDGEYIIDLSAGEAIQEVPKGSDFFEFITSLHRSLFLKNTGRFIIGINSLLLFLIACTGSILVIKRQHGIKNLFKKVIRLDFPSYSHTYLGRIMLLPLVILSLSAVLLFLIRFEYIPTTKTESEMFEDDSSIENRPIEQFDIFKQHTLADLESIEFPFSEFEEDYFILHLKDNTYAIHQYTGQILEQTPATSTDAMYRWSYFLHTGKGSIIWSIVLGSSGLSILYFMYSGFLIVKPRLKRKNKNRFNVQEAEFIVLYGSETGSTHHFANLFFESLIEQDKKAFIAPLNNYQTFPEMKYLVIFTSTHGKGEAPHNAHYFEEKFNKIANSQPIHYAIIGFGSTHYPKFCAFAKEIHQLIDAKENFNEIVPLELIDNRSTEALKHWWNDWNQKSKIKTMIPKNLIETHPLSTFSILNKNIVDDGFGTTFLLSIKPQKKFHYESGDLLGIYPPNEPIERYYSIGKIDNDNFVISVRLHDKGLCSRYLYQLKVGDSLNGFVSSNPEFHLNLSAPSITFISNGTGIAPYLGMITKFKGKKYFYWGGRNSLGWKLYENYFSEQEVNEFELAFSREKINQRYIQDIIKTRQAIIFSRLQAGGIIMFCGSMQMQGDVMEMLDNYADEHDLPSMQYWEQQGQVKIDTY